MERDRLALDDVAALLNGGQASGRLDAAPRPGADDGDRRAERWRASASSAPASAAGSDAKLDFVGAGDNAAALVGGLAGRRAD